MGTDDVGVGIISNKENLFGCQTVDIEQSNCLHKHLWRRFINAKQLRCQNEGCGFVEPCCLSLQVLELVAIGNDAPVDARPVYPIHKLFYSGKNFHHLTHVRKVEVIVGFGIAYHT